MSLNKLKTIELINRFELKINKYKIVRNLIHYKIIRVDKEFSVNVNKVDLLKSESMSKC